MAKMLPCVPYYVAYTMIKDLSKNENFFRIVAFAFPKTVKVY